MKNTTKEIGIKRPLIQRNGTIEMARFVSYGRWADGHIVYCKLEDDGTIKEEHEGVYYQYRLNGRLVMEHI